MSDVARPTPHPIANYINLVMIPIAMLDVLLVVSEIHSPVRLWLTVLLFVLGPGSGLTQFLRLPDASMQLGMVFALSMAVDLLLGQCLLWTHNLSGTTAVIVLAAITCIRPFYRSDRSTTEAAAA